MINLTTELKMNLLEEYRPYGDEIIADWHESRESLKRYLGDDTDASLLDLVNMLKEKDRIARMPWYLKDSDGWPIERIKGRPVFNYIRILVQNFRKMICRM